MTEPKSNSYGNVHSHKHSKWNSIDEESRKPSENISSVISKETQKQLDLNVCKRTDLTFASSIKSNVSFIKYRSKQQTREGYSSETSHRIIKIHELQSDPLNQANFKQRKTPTGPRSPSKTLMHSPPRKLTTKDQDDWKIPPSISNSKNIKGYSIPLEMRIAADGRKLQQNTVNEKHPKFANAIFITEKQVRKEIEKKRLVQGETESKKILKQEEKMREAASLARKEKKLLESVLEERNDEEASGVRKPSLSREEKEARNERNMLRYINKREQERESRIDRARKNKGKNNRDIERDISEKIALGQAQTRLSKEQMYDQRLFNQTSGLDSGFGNEDDYNAFDQPLFGNKITAPLFKFREFEKSD